MSIASKLRSAKKNPSGPQANDFIVKDTDYPSLVLCVIEEKVNNLLDIE